MVNATEKLAIVPDRDSDVPEPTVYRFDRRRDLRHDLGGCVTALRRDHEVNAYRHPVCSLRLRNMSEGGLGVISDVPLGSEERIAVYFQPHGSDTGFEMFGHVVRCLPVRTEDANESPLATGYEIGIRFDPPAAA
ncbi:MAG: hypothetical protein GC162_17620 [Planctomycetes bacterium]|nr:hypothetical protein [Planctomycetota bacterium]